MQVNEAADLLLDRATELFVRAGFMTRDPAFDRTEYAALMRAGRELELAARQITAPPAFPALTIVCTPAGLAVIDNVTGRRRADLEPSITESMGWNI